MDQRHQPGLARPAGPPERERQRQAAQRKSASQVPTEPDPKPRTSYGQQHTPSRAKPDSTGFPGSERRADSTPRMLAREVPTPPPQASQPHASASQPPSPPALPPHAGFDDTGFVPVQPEGATSPEPHPAMTRSAPARPQDKKPAQNTKLPGGSEACTYHAGPMDGDLIAEGKDAGQRILRKVLALDHSCEFVTLAFPDGTRQIMQLGKAGRKPGDPGPGSM